PETGWHYFNPDGTYVQNKWVGAYYLKQWGYMATNEWIFDKDYDNWFFINEDGSYAHDTWKGSYYLKQYGHMAHNEWAYSPETGWHYFNPDGTYVQNQWVGAYYLKQWGYMAQNEWIWDANNSSYFFIGEDGKYVQNQWVGDYYLKQWGYMAKNEWIGKYYVGSDGKWEKTSDDNNNNNNNNVDIDDKGNISIKTPKGQTITITSIDDKHIGGIADSIPKSNGDWTEDTTYLYLEDAKGNRTFFSLRGHTDENKKTTFTMPNSLAIKKGDTLKIGYYELSEDIGHYYFVPQFTNNFTTFKATVTVKGINYYNKPWKFSENLMYCPLAFDGEITSFTPEFIEGKIDPKYAGYKIKFGQHHAEGVLSATTISIVDKSGHFKVYNTLFQNYYSTQVWLFDNTDAERLTIDISLPKDKDEYGDPAHEWGIGAPFYDNVAYLPEGVENVYNDADLYQVSDNTIFIKNKVTPETVKNAMTIKRYNEDLIYPKDFQVELVQSTVPVLENGAKTATGQVEGTIIYADGSKEQFTREVTVTVINDDDHNAISSTREDINRLVANKPLKAYWSDEETQAYDEYITKKSKTYPVNQTEGNVDDIVTLPWDDQQVVPLSELPLDADGDLEFLKYHEIAKGRALPRQLTMVENDIYGNVKFSLYPKSYYKDGSLADETLTWELMTLEQRNSKIDYNAKYFIKYNVKGDYNEYGQEPAPDFETIYHRDVDVDTQSVYTVDQFNALSETEVAKVLGYNQVFKYKLAKGEAINGKIERGNTCVYYVVERKRYYDFSEKRYHEYIDLAWNTGEYYNPAYGIHYTLYDEDKGAFSPRVDYEEYDKESDKIHHAYQAEYLFSAVPDDMDGLLNIEFPEAYQYARVTNGRPSRAYINEPEIPYVPGQ
ncbi:hypothetical protein ACWOAW_09880, partial [Granulicatella balaenopterae]